LSAGLRIRDARPDDAALLLSMIHALAEYERLADQTAGSEELLQKWLFGPDPAAEAMIAERDGVPVAFAIFYRTFSTFESEPGLWLEDLFVLEEHRGAGVGAAIMTRLAALTVQRGYKRLEWVALDWNAPALAFYDALGAERLSDWEVLRLHGERLREVAAGA
jgi:GNAT superfamily N-acetyltransferase